MPSHRGVGRVSSQGTPCGLDSPAQAYTPPVAWTFLSKHTRPQWLGHSCPSSSRRRGRRRYGFGCFVGGDALRRQSGCDDIPVVAQSVGKTIPVAWTFLSKQFSSARTPTLRGWVFYRRGRFTTPKRVRRHSCRRRTSEQDAPRGLDILVQAKLVGGGMLCDAKKGVAPVLAWLGHSCPSIVRRRGRRCCDAKKGVAPMLAWLGQSCPSVVHRRCCRPHRR